jgi:antitoxin component of MazEF toxin-antitoxin module
VKRKIRKLGSSAIIVISKPMLETLGLKIGDSADIKAIKQGQVLITKVEGDK